MNELQWLTSENPNEMLNFLRPWASERSLRLFACACCRDIWDWLEHDFERGAVQAAESYADGECSVIELLKANNTVSRHINPRQDHQAIDNYWSHLASVVTHGDAWDSASAVEWKTTYLRRDDRENARKRHCEILRDIFGNPFLRPTPSVKFPVQVVELPQSIYDRHRFDELPSLKGLLLEADADEAVIQHCHVASHTSVAVGQSIRSWANTISDSNGHFEL